MSFSDTTWLIGGISSPSLTWGAVRRDKVHECPYCHIPLLTGEYPGFCCGPKGKYLNAVGPALPPYPNEYNDFISHPKISTDSRILNLIFSFASLETTHPFPDAGPQSFFAIQGRIYHRVRPSHNDSAVRWLLYDGFLASSAPHATWASKIPRSWIESLRSALLRVNPFVTSLKILGEIDATLCPNAELIIEDTGSSPEIAAIMNYENTTQSEIKARKLLIIKKDGSQQQISTVSRFWEPLAYPLLFPHATLGWGDTWH